MDPTTEALLDRLMDELKEQRSVVKTMTEAQRETAVALEHLRGQIQLLGIQLRAHDTLAQRISTAEQKLAEVDKRADKFWWVAGLIGTATGIISATMIRWFLGGDK